MRKYIGRVRDDVLIESVVVQRAGHAEHRYRLVGGPDTGREFTTLAALGDYVIGLGVELPY